MPYFSARLDFPSPPLSAPGSPRMAFKVNNLAPMTIFVKSAVADAHAKKTPVLRAQVPPQHKEAKFYARLIGPKMCFFILDLL